MGQHVLLKNKHQKRWNTEVLKILREANEWFVAICMWDGSLQGF